MCAGALSPGDSEFSTQPDSCMWGMLHGKLHAAQGQLRGRPRLQRLLLGAALGVYGEVHVPQRALDHGQRVRALRVGVDAFIGQHARHVLEQRRKLQLPLLVRDLLAAAQQVRTEQGTRREGHMDTDKISAVCSLAGATCQPEGSPVHTTQGRRSASMPSPNQDVSHTSGGPGCRPLPG